MREAEASVFTVVVCFYNWTIPTTFWTENIYSRRRRRQEKKKRKKERREEMKGREVER